MKCFKNKNRIIILLAICVFFLLVLTGIVIKLLQSDTWSLNDKSEWNLNNINDATVSFNQNGMTTDLINNHDDHFYIWTGKENSFNIAPPLSSGYEFDAGKEYTVSFKGLNIHNSANASFWVIMYDDMDRIDGISIPIDNQTHKIAINEQTMNTRVLIRFAGSGAITIKSITIAEGNFIFSEYLLYILIIFILVILFILFKRRKISSEAIPNKLSKIIMLIVGFAMLLFVLYLLFGNIGTLLIKANYIPIYIVFFAGIILILFLVNNRIVQKVKISHIILLAVLIRLAWCFAVRTVPVVDFANFWSATQNVLTSSSVFHTKAPSTVIFYSMVLSISNSLFSVYIANCLIAGIQAYLIYKIAYYITKNEIKSNLAALLFALYPMGIAYTSVFSSEVVFISCVLLLVYLGIRKYDYDLNQDNKVFSIRNITYLVLIGLTIAFGYLSRSTMLVFAAVFFLFILCLFPKELLRKAIEIVLIVSIFCIALIPQIVHNDRIHDEFSISPNPYGGYVLLFGTSEESNGGYNRKEIETIMEKSGEIDVSKLSAIAQEEAIKRITKDPVGFAKFALTKKFMRMWADDYYYSWTVNGSALFEDMSEKKSKLFNSTHIYYMGLCLLALIGVILNIFKKNKWIFFLNSCILAVVFLHLFFEVQPRYKLPLIPFICILAAYGLGELFDLNSHYSKIKKLLDSFKGKILPQNTPHKKDE